MFSTTKVDTINYLRKLLKLSNVIHLGDAFTPTAIDILKGAKSKYLLTERLFNELVRLNKSQPSDLKIEETLLQQNSLSLSKLFDNTIKKEFLSFSDLSRNAEDFLFKLHYIIDRTCGICAASSGKIKLIDKEIDEKIEHASSSIFEQKPLSSTLICQRRNCTSAADTFTDKCCLNAFISWIKGEMNRYTHKILRFILSELRSIDMQNRRSQLFFLLKERAEEDYFCKVNLNPEHSTEIKIYFRISEIILFLIIASNIVVETTFPIEDDSARWINRFLAVVISILIIIFRMHSFWLNRNHQLDYEFFSDLRRNNGKLYLEIEKCFVILCCLREKLQPKLHHTAINLPKHAKVFYAFAREDIDLLEKDLKEWLNIGRSVSSEHHVRFPLTH